MNTLASPVARHELKIFGLLAVAFLAVYFLPVGEPRFDSAVIEALELTKWYAREHVVLCLLPAFWIAGAIAAFVSQASVMRYLGPTAPKPLAYGVGSISGSVLAVCSCTVLPLFSGIYRMGAGLGPAVAFLYAGPAVNVLAIVLTAKVLGAPLGFARAASAVVFSLAIGLAMTYLFRKEERRKAVAAADLPRPAASRPLWQTATLFAVLIAILVFANWSAGDGATLAFAAVAAAKWWVTAVLGLALAVLLWRWLGLPPARIVAVAAATAATAIVLPDQPTAPFLVAVLGLAWLTAGRAGEAGVWFEQAWSYTKQIVPLLLGGVLLAGFLLGRPGHEGLVPSAWIAGLVGGNSLGANVFAAASGALMYFATLTEVPIVQGLVGNGMGDGPALALLLAGPALSLPSVLVLNSILGPRKTGAYVALVVVGATACGWAYGYWLAT